MTKILNTLSHFQDILARKERTLEQELMTIDLQLENAATQLVEMGEVTNRW